MHTEKDFHIERGNLRKTVEWLTGHTPYRLAGSAQEREAARYVCAGMEACGLETSNRMIRSYNSTPRSSRLRVLSPVDEAMDSLPCAHVECTPPGGTDYELVYVGDGGETSYEGRDMGGKLALVEVSYAPPVPEKARIAWKHGAAGIVCMNWGNDEKVICRRGLKAVWGNPTEETIREMPRIIGISVTHSDGTRLKELCGRGRVQVHVEVEADRYWSEVSQPMGILRGETSSGQFILVGSHLDAWEPGVTCNATGNATALELCRALAREKSQLTRDIWFVFWDGHEIAEAAGSTWFADHYWEDLDKNCVAYVNIDSTGVSETELFEIKASEELLALATDTVGRGLPGTEIRAMSLKKIGDQSFMGIGIPAVAQRMSFSQEYMDRNHGATLGWWNHTREDGLDKYDLETLYNDTLLTCSLIWRLATEEVLPYDLDTRFRAIQEGLARLDGNGHFDLAPLVERVAQARAAVAEIQDHVEALHDADSRELYNRYVMRVTRLLTNVAQTYADRWQQDSYGYSKLSAPLPLLADLSRLNALDPTTLEFGMIETQLVKNKNRILDALNRTLELSELYRTKLGYDGAPTPDGNSSEFERERLGREARSWKSPKKRPK